MDRLTMGELHPKCLNVSAVVILLAFGVGRVRADDICPKQKPTACISQPVTGDTLITGFVATKKDGHNTIYAEVTNVVISGQQVPKAAITANGSKDGKFSIQVSPLNKYNQIVISEGDLDPPQLTAGVEDSSQQGIHWLGLAGLGLTSTASGPQQQWFARASLMKNLFPYPGTKSNQGGVWGWLDAKIGSIPTQKTSAVSSLTSVSSAVSSSGTQTIGDIAQTLEFRTGLSFFLHRNIGFVSGFGAASPISSITGAQEYTLSKALYSQFTSSTALQTQYPQLYSALTQCYSSPTPGTTCAVTTVAFVLPSRSRFYRNYFGGVRIWTHGGEGSTFPGLLDVTIGQDETVTGGTLHGVVLTLTGDYPVGKSGMFRLFASSYMRIATNTNTVALNMEPVTSAVDPTSSSVVIQDTLPLDRDYFRVGGRR